MADSFELRIIADDTDDANFLLAVSGQIRTCDESHYYKQVARSPFPSNGWGPGMSLVGFRRIRVT